MPYFKINRLVTQEKKKKDTKKPKYSKEKDIILLYFTELQMSLIVKSIIILSRKEKKNPVGYEKGKL